MAKPRRYHYTECGLDNIYLVNGFDYVTTPRGKSVNIKDIEGLHRAIGQSLVRDKRNLTGKDFRFLRHELNLTQQSLASLLRVDVQTLARWEKGQTKRPIDGTAQEYLKWLYEEYATGNEKITKPLKELVEIAEMIDDSEDGFIIDMDIALEETEDGWQPTLEAA